MGKNVIILGAGFSKDAGIPLLSELFQAIWDAAYRGTIREQKLTETEHQVFRDAVRARDYLDRYHGRAIFDDKNVEDLMSLLSFGVMGGGRSDKRYFLAVKKAIALLIQKSCLVKHHDLPMEGDLGQMTRIKGPFAYLKFWSLLFSQKRATGELPTIISLNYDLVLELSLLQLFNNEYFNRHNWPSEYLRVNYHFQKANYELLKLVPINWPSSDPTKLPIPGLSVVRSASAGASDLTEIDILKLHGSLNFTTNREKPLLTSYCSDPFIQPPVFNKSGGGTDSGIWKCALQRLKEAHNVIIIGYSLPKSDVYMQYFFKAGIGPNTNIQKIIVFNPELWSDRGAAMKSRYASCFSEQLSARINFQPHIEQADKQVAGTLYHFLDTLETNPSSLFFS